VESVRRVVAAQAREGRSIVIADDDVAAFALDPLPGHWHTVIWGGDGVPELPYTDQNVPSSFPMLAIPGGFMFGVLTIEPESAVTSAKAKSTAEPFMKYPDPAYPRMHGGDGVTFMAVMEGEIWIELDSGEEFHLRQGDTYVQLGVRKAYWNRSDVPCRIAVASMGARRRV
jgi:hypothetical protein